MLQENKNQLTLYRFVSLRSPELLKKENQKQRFVFHPDNKSGHFYTELDSNHLLTEEKWDALHIISQGFNGFQSNDELENAFGEFYILSEWITRSKNDLDALELIRKIKHLKLLDSNKEFEIWDNLFYQIVTQKSFYIREALIQILILQNLLKQIELLDNDDEKLKSLAILVNAKVVLPEYLFKENQNVNSAKKTKKTQKNEDDVILEKELVDAQLIQLSKINIENLENLTEKLEEFEKRYYQNYQQKHDSYLKDYQENYSIVVNKYIADYDEERRNLCDSVKDEHYDPNDFCYQPNIKIDELPRFDFSFQDEFSLEELAPELSEEDYGLLKSIIYRKNVSTFKEAIALVSKEIEKESASISQRIITSEKTVTFGDTVISASQPAPLSTAIPFQICSSRLSNGNASMYLSMQLPDNTYDVRYFHYILHYSTGENSGHLEFVKTKNGNVITLSNLFNNTIQFSLTDKVVEITGKIKFSNGQEFTLSVRPFSLRGCYSGKLETTTTNSESGATDGQTSYTPKGFGYKQLGIADYKKVVAEVCCYEPGEVAHIENVMASELRSKVTTKSYKSEVTDFESSEIEKENMTDVVSTERFEMQTEVAKLLAQQKQLSSYADVHTSWGNTTLDAGIAYASNTSKEESNRQAVIQAKELTQRAVEKIVSKVRTEKTVKITNEFIEENTHAFDNRGNSSHISGVFRFINAVYKNQIFNYGKRLMYEFVVPQPSKLHRLAMLSSQNNENTVIIEKPIDPATLGITDFTKISASNYQHLASKYDADTEVYPKTQIFLNKTVSSVHDGPHEIIEGSAELQIPEGYQPISAKLKFSAKWDKDGGQLHSANIAFGNYALYGQNLHSDIKEINLSGYQYEYLLDSFTDKISFSYGLINYTSCNISLSIKNQIAPEKIESWKKSTYNAIIKGYQEQLRLYNEKISEAKTTGVQILDSNPLFYRQIEQMVLRKNCISYLLDNSVNSNRRFGKKMYTGDSIINHHITANQEMEDYASFAKFMEQAFEWNLMSYNFYPYYWGYDGEWSSLYQHESNDLTFRSFMQAGMARVVVTVKPGFEDAVMHYMATGQIWNGGQIPILEDPLYLSIVDELKEQEYTVQETWKTVVPTHLIGLQTSGVSVDEGGLPCNCPAVDELNSTLVKNSNILISKPE
ncbi:hypothetical protein ACFPVY_08570 [Flavobacterium qiangtangense]|uniref:Uncharacterized protein n=1 Tax=Flavobacterium qiangtangense TaxID=1442595 RepID=A0ABW1PM44_9FLAO